MDVPDLTEIEKRGLIYIRDINQELEQVENPTITQLTNESDWSSKYYTTAWQRLQPKGLVKRETDGMYTRLSVTSKGAEAVTLLKQLNEVLMEAENQ